jgi:hypothetical protein
METLATYKTMVQNEVDDYSARAGNVIERALKDTYQEILRYTAKDLVGTEQETKTGSTSNRYVTPSSFMSIEDVQWHDAGDTDYVQLKPITEEEYLKLYVNADSGTPSMWYANGSRIYFDKTPDTAGTALITYVPVQDELEGSTTSVIPDRFTQVLLLGSIARFKAYERLPDAREYEGLYAGPFYRQGRIEGALGSMMEELRTKGVTFKPKLWGL